MSVPALPEVLVDVLRLGELHHLARAGVLGLQHVEGVARRRAPVESAAVHRGEGLGRSGEV